MLVELDVETTGRPSPKSHIIEVAAVVLDPQFQEIGHFQSLANPGDEAMLLADPEALRVNRITPEMVRAAPPAEEVARRLRVWLDQFWGATFHAFNKEFDQWFLEKTPWTIKPRHWGECVMHAAMERMGSAGALGTRYDGTPKYPKLSEAAAFFKVPYGEGHRALHDCRIAGKVHAEIIRQRINEEECDPNDETLYLTDYGM
jgi:DNA polymerase III epsilon subunit-like protein